MEQKKKPTNAQLQKRLNNAILHIDRTKDTKSIYFDDKGLRLTVNEDYAVIETGYHRHVFNNFTTSGISRPYLYVQRLIDIALDNASQMTIEKENGNTGFSYSKLLDALKGNKDKNLDYLIAYYCDMYFYTIFQNLYSIGESVSSTFFVYFSYLCGIVRNSIILDEHKEPLTNKQFISKFCDTIKELSSAMEEQVIIEAKSDEERMEEEINAIQEQLSDESQN